MKNQCTTWINKIRDKILSVINPDQTLRVRFPLRIPQAINIGVRSLPFSIMST